MADEDEAGQLANLHLDKTTGERVRFVSMLVEPGLTLRILSARAS